MIGCRPHLEVEGLVARVGDVQSHGKDVLGEVHLVPEANPVKSKRTRVLQFQFRVERQSKGKGVANGQSWVRKVGEHELESPNAALSQLYRNEGAKKGTPTLTLGSKNERALRMSVHTPERCGRDTT